MGTYGSYLVETVAMLGVVTAIAFATMLLAKRLGVGRAHGPIELVGQLPVDARRAFYLVKVGSKVFFVGVGEGAFAKLGELTADELPATPPKGPAFAELFSKALSRRAGASEPAPSPTPAPASEPPREEPS